MTQSLYPYHQGGNDFLEQWERTQRWYEKVKKIQNNELRIFTVQDHEDFILAYCFNAYHLQDWLKHCKGDTNFGKLFQKKSSVVCLKILADLVTNYKHFENSNFTRIDKDTWLVSRDACAQIGQGKGSGDFPAHTWWLTSKNTKVNLYDLADDTFQEIKNYLLQNNYIQ